MLLGCRMTRASKMVVICLILLVSALTFNRRLVQVDDVTLQSAQRQEKTSQEIKKDLLIVLWEYIHPNRLADITHERPLACHETTAPRSSCNCRFTADIGKVNISDAVLGEPKMFMNVGLDRVDKLRKEGQYWILLNSEWLDPKDEQLPVLKPNMFNMTASYHRGSEIHIPYGQCGERKEKYTFNYNKLADKKNECLWYVSNCKDSRSRRSDYANELGRYIPVTVRGKCGPEKNLTMSRANLGQQFNDTVETNSYKFYLSFENTYCKDYMTEKVFRMLQDTIHSVPIVRGSGPYKSVLPPHSYIDTADFKSPKALADYLLILTKNDQLYEEYFAWRSKYKCYNLYNDNVNEWPCRICEHVCRMRENNILQPSANTDVLKSSKNCFFPKDIYDRPI